MKPLTVLLFLLMPAFSYAQYPQLPTAVVDSFNKDFPGGIIISWTGNNYYNYTSDWNNDAYFDDFNLDGYADGYYYDDEPFFSAMGDDIPFYYDDDLDFNYFVPDNYQMGYVGSPSQYQLNFRYKGLKMTGIFKPKGTLVLAKARVVLLPETIVGAIKNTFKGKYIRLAHAKELLMTPQYLHNPVYRVKVFIRHDRYSILKIDSKGRILSNDHY
ncbi:MAG: hypothetical protein JXR71_03670 [Bacteroidales bacterium]|nr:hypothetical protein [Bacteroidales bacterium]